MKSGDLKAVIISVLDSNIGLSVKDVQKKAIKISDKDYAYTTIATILNRLEKDRIAIKRKAKIDNRTVNLYYLSETGYKREVRGLLKDLFQKFGYGGVKHLGELLDTDFDDKELAEIEKKLNS